MREEILKDPNATAEERAVVAILTVASMPSLDGRDRRDSAESDMDIDNAMALNKKISTLKNVYYFSYACSATEPADGGIYLPKDGAVEGLYRACSVRMGRFSGTTNGGYAVDEKWRENDGLVNTYSALAPIGAPAVGYNSANVRTGIWNIMPIYQGDHMSLQGGMTVNNNVRVFYIELLSMINSL